MDNVAVDGSEMQHLNHGFQSNSLYLELKNRVSVGDPTRILRKEEYDGRNKKR